MNKQSFKKGNVPWNKGMKGIRLNPNTEFKPGQFVGENHPSWKGGIQIPKNDCVHLYKGIGERVRRPREVWKEHYGDIPSGHVIIHLDGNNLNDDISNLDCISRKDNLIRNNENRCKATRMCH